MKLTASSASRATCIALCVAGASLFVESSQAAEYALGNYLLGVSVPMSGFTPPPGLYFQDALWVYRGSAGPNVTIPRGNLLATNVTERYTVNIATLSWFSPWEVLGGTFGLAASVPYGNVNVSADVAFTGPLGVGRELGRTDSTTGFGQPAFTALLGWHAGVHNWNVSATGFVPAGDYSPNSLAIVSLNRPSVDVRGGYTYLDTKTGTELSAALGTTFNMTNPAIDYKSGVELHLEGAWQQHLQNGISFGFGGYYYQQLSGDSGSRAVLGPFEGTVVALGPLLGYTTKFGDTPVDFNAHVFQEFDTTNRVAGFSFLASVTVQLWNPSPPAATKAIPTK
jgi:hypothetical protein